VGEAEVERFRVRDGHVGVHVLEAEEESRCGRRGEAAEGVAAEGEAAEGEAAEGERVAVDAGGEGGVDAVYFGGPAVKAVCWMRRQEDELGVLLWPGVMAIAGAAMFAVLLNNHQRLIKSTPNFEH